jgi:hypothetical protein
MKYFISSLGFWSKNVTSILNKNILLLKKNNNNNKSTNINVKENNLVKYLWQSQARTWICNSICRSCFLTFIELRREVIACVFDIGGIFYHCCFNFLFIYSGNIKTEWNHVFRTANITCSNNKTCSLLSGYWLIKGICRKGLFVLYRC